MNDLGKYLDEIVKPTLQGFTVRRKIASGPHGGQSDVAGEDGILSLKPDLRLEWRGQDLHDETQEPEHSASLDSITSATRTRFSVHTPSQFHSKSRIWRQDGYAV